MTELSAGGPSPPSELSDQRKVAEATHTLALLNEQADGMRAELSRLQRELEQLPRDSSGTRSTRLMEANEQLVLAAIRAEAVAELAVSNLGELARSSQRDVLTDTPNRTVMLDRLEKAIAMARRRGTRMAVLFLDIDNFKQINDKLGHAGGDEVVQLVARRLKSVVRDSDTVSRFGGDEFVVLLTEVAQALDAARVAAKLLSSLAAPSRVGGHVLRMSASLGIAIFPEDGADATTLISHADAAMYRSKRAGRGSFEFHTVQPASDDGGEPLTLDLRSQPTMRYELELTGQEPSMVDLREANERLVIAALTAQELEAHAKAAHDRQIKFMATVAHELRNPLNPIRTAAVLLKDERTDEPLLERLQVIIARQVAHMSRLVDDLLDGARASTGKFRLERVTVEMADVLGVAVESIRPAIDARKQHLTVKLPTHPLIVQGDPVRLTQVFSNLVDNASKYTPDGGAIALTVVAQSDALVITVSDSGVGITAEALPNIFDLFVQDPRGPARHNRGLGIGLAVVRELVVAHGGTVVGKSAGKDLGSEFVVTLPRADTPAVGS